ncbi:protein kinase, partial [bacterium]|nr:protein kinase [bacterium]
MPIQVQCSSCKAAWNVADEKATVAGKCPRCGAAVTVQEAAPPSPPPAQKGISLSSGMAAAGALLQHLAPDAGAPTVLEIEHARTDPRRRFGHFIVLSLVGKGGMGAVYRAWDDNLRRTVALKVVLSSQDGTSATSLQRFQREAHAIARLRHPCIVSVHDTGEIGGKPYLAMDFIVGTTLERRIGKRTGTILDTPERAARLPLTKAVEVLRDVSRAVQYAHEQGVIHRDLKPGNIMLDAKDHPFVLDFGLAKVRDDASFVTKGGGAMGTPAYMPPEQAGGTSEEVDERSDIYALGATLYHAIAGRPPFEGESEINVITLLLTKDARPPSTYNRLATGDLDTICLKCLEKDKKKRFQSAGDIAAELDRYLAGEPILTRPLGFLGRAGRSLRRNARTVAIAGLAALLSTGAVLYPALQSSLEESGRRAASARAREAVLEAARSLRGKTGTALEKSTKRLDGLRSGPRGFLSDVAQVVSELDTGTLALADESALRAELRAAGTAAGGPKTPAPDLERALEDGLTLLGRGALLAKAARERGRGFQLLSRPTDAAKERARAYRLDPAGEDGARAFVEIAEDLLEREDWPRALGLFRTIASRKLPPAISARAHVGEARALIALEKPEAARSLLSRALSQKVLGERETAEARWFLAVASRLSGTVSVPVDG